MSNRSQLSLPTILAAAALAHGLIASPARAQVGHDPAHSPYHDLNASHQFTFTGGFLAGSGGRVGVGPRNGPLGGLRYSITLGSSLELTLGLFAADLERHLVDPTAQVDKRSAGTVTQSVMIPDAGFNLRITGGKTWHRFMPYAGVSLGAAAGGTVTQDNSGYSFNTPFQWGPHLGVRWYGGGPFSFWVEGWDPMWKLHYPQSFFTTTPPVLNISSDPTREWVHNPVILAGFALILRR